MQNPPQEKDQIRRLLAESYIVLIQFQDQPSLTLEEKEKVVEALGRMEALLEGAETAISAQTWFRVLGSRAYFAALRAREEVLNRKKPAAPQPVPIRRGVLVLRRSA